MSAVNKYVKDSLTFNDCIVHDVSVNSPNVDLKSVRTKLSSKLNWEKKHIICRVIKHSPYLESREDAYIFEKLLVSTVTQK